MRAAQRGAPKVCKIILWFDSFGLRKKIGPYLHYYRAPVSIESIFRLNK